MPPVFLYESYKESAELTDVFVQVDYLGSKVKTEWVVQTWGWRVKGHVARPSPSYPHYPSVPCEEAPEQGRGRPAWQLTVLGRVYSLECSSLKCLSPHPSCWR